MRACLPRRHNFAYSTRDIDRQFALNRWAGSSFGSVETYCTTVAPPMSLVLRTHCVRVDFVGESDDDFPVLRRQIHNWLVLKQGFGRRKQRTCGEAVDGLP